MTPPQLSDDRRAQLTELIQSQPVTLFMKGSRQRPQCGFSATVVGILDTLVSDYQTIDVLSDPELREEIKVYSSWPTIPQLFIKGEFIGGCDIVKEMHQSGELGQLLGIDQKAPKAPQVHVSKRALETFSQALQGQQEKYIRVQINSQYQSSLSFSEKAPYDVVVELEGLALLLDPISAERAEGLAIDFVEQGQQSGFKIDNPNSPPQVQQLTVHQLREKLDRGEKFEFFDVRTPEERKRAKIAGTKLLDEEARTYISQLDKNTPLVFHCHHGMRSQAAAEYFLSQGFRHVYNVQGGIDAWSREIDPNVPIY